MIFTCQSCKQKTDYLERCRTCRKNFCSTCTRRGKCHSVAYGVGNYGQGYSGGKGAVNGGHSYTNSQRTVRW